MKEILRRLTERIDLCLSYTPLKWWDCDMAIVQCPGVIKQFALAQILQCLRLIILR